MVQLHHNRVLRHGRDLGVTQNRDEPAAMRTPRRPRSLGARRRDALERRPVVAVAHGKKTFHPRNRIPKRYFPVDDVQSEVAYRHEAIAMY